GQELADAWLATASADPAFPQLFHSLVTFDEDNSEVYTAELPEWFHGHKWTLVRRVLYTLEGRCGVVPIGLFRSSGAELNAGADLQRRLLVNPALDTLIDPGDRVLALAEDEADLRETEDVFRALGFLDGDDDLVSQLEGVLSAGVVGFYDPETNELVVRGESPTPYARSTIVHELTHALDDQHFELARPELDDADDETGFAFSALVEGNAVTVEEAYQATFTDDERRAYDEEEAAIGDSADFSQFPEILLALIGAPYELGPPLIDAIVDHGGETAVDQAFGDPPVSSEQVLDPDLYLSGEQPLDVAEPPADGEVFDQGTFGQFLLLVLLT
ncbi:MAG: hypothetical protein KC468_21025, partial [Myxococcales bacterium]|nr:hypothetical protein [Myxococcales bacterium]